MKIIVVFFCLIRGIICVGEQYKKIDTNVISREVKNYNPKKQCIKVALLLDTSSSMKGVLDQVKAQLWDIINELSYAKYQNNRPNLEVAIYEYGNDNLNKDTGYIKQVLVFSSDLDDVSRELFSLTTNGGNEFCTYVIDTSLKQLNWGENNTDLKFIFIAGNELFSQREIDYTEVAKKAREKNIIINSIYCGDYSQGINNLWKNVADLTNGNYIALNQNQETVTITSPYDKEILELNKALNHTYIPYEKLGHKRVLQKKIEDSMLNSKAVSQIITKSTYLYENSKWDLVDAEDESWFNYDNLKDYELPKELKGKTKRDIKKHVEFNKQARKTIKDKIKRLHKNRMKFISEKAITKSNSLDNILIQAIKKHAQEKNYKWD
jgi:hypothetical protein